MIPGLVSVTFRQLTPEAIIAHCLENHLQAIEWGGDIHVPHGEEQVASEVGEMTRTAGLTVAAYGSYYRLGTNSELDFSSVLATARALGAPVIRVWAGNCGSANCTDVVRQNIVDDALRCADLAGSDGITIAYEFHGNTLTDTTSSALELLQSTEHPFIKTLWQPPNGCSLDEGVASLRAISSRLQHIHVFHWWPDASHRRPLLEGVERWKTFLQALPSQGSGYPVLLEFVRGDSSDSLKQDAKTLVALSKELTSDPR